jgi:tetratricopeptide (TPR) repeat protein
VHDVGTGPDEFQELAAELRRAAAGPALDEPDLHSDLAELYDRLGRVEEALTHAEVLVERGYRCAPDPRCRRAEILTRHGRLAEAAAVWDEVARDTPDDVWVYDNAGLEYADIGEYDTALTWLTQALQLAVRTGGPRAAARPATRPQGHQPGRARPRRRTATRVDRSVPHTPGFRHIAAHPQDRPSSAGKSPR